MTAELLQPDELISGMISQVAAEPEMALLLNHFIYSTAGTHSTCGYPGFTLLVQTCRDERPIESPVTLGLYAYLWVVLFM